VFYKTHVIQKYFYFTIKSERNAGRRERRKEGGGRKRKEGKGEGRKKGDKEGGREERGKKGHGRAFQGSLRGESNFLNQQTTNGAISQGTPSEQRDLVSYTYSPSLSFCRSCSELSP
jgi:hypothetical protein